MKILICCHQPYATGANLALLDWLKDATDSEDQFYVVLPFPNKSLQQAFEDVGCTVWIGYYSVPVRHLRKRPFKKRILDFLQIAYAVVCNTISRKRLSAKLKSHNIDIVHSNSFATLYGAVLAVENGLPHVWHIREFMESDHKIEHFNKGKAQRLAQASSAIFISPAVEKAYNGRFTFKTTTTILDKVSRDSKYHKSRQFMEDGVCRLLMVGALSPEKGQLDAIQAVQELEQKGYNVRLTLCGSGDVSYIAPYLQTKNVRYLGQQDDLTMIRQQSDIALVCSRNEAFGRVSIEAMYYGNVLIGADAGFTKELIKEGKNGFLYRVGSPSNLAEKVEFLMKNPEEADSVGEYASAVSTVFAKPIFPQIADYYKRVVEGAQGKPREY